MFKPGVTVNKIVVWIRTKEEGQPEISGQDGVARKGYMGATMLKGEGVLTPLALLVKLQPNHKK